MKQKITSYALYGCLSLAAILTSTMPTAAALTQFTFGTVGDHGSSASTTGTFRAAGSAQLNFFLSLGDLSYDPAGFGSEGTWCQYVKDNLNTGAGYATGNSYGEQYPFEIIAGNHESDQTQGNGLIENFVAQSCLPNRLTISESSNLGTNPSSIGNYAKEYYFDYPQGNPLARFIMASPGQNFQYGGAYTYTVGNARYQWLSNTIDAARAAGIKWVIVANHKNYISTGAKSNELGPDYFNLLVSKKVDLVLEGHDHTYQRSKQFAFGTGCTTIATGTADLDCVVDDGSDNMYSKNAGPVLTIAGNGGKGFYSTSLSDGEAPYFANVMNDTSQTAGYVKITINARTLSATLLRGGGASFTDSYTIRDQNMSEDILSDGVVNVRDFSVLSANYGLSGATIKNARADITGDGTVNLADFSKLALAYGS